MANCETESPSEVTELGLRGARLSSISKLVSSVPSALNSLK